MTIRKHPLIIATRGSRLALAQARWVAERLEKSAPGLPVEMKTITTKGDLRRDLPFARVGGKGIFTKEIEQALLAGQADLAVHSMKDLPTQIPGGLRIGAVPYREDPHDVLILREAECLERLPKGARVGTSSLRRRAQLLAVRPDLRVQEFRGNLDTRLRKLERGEVDAIVVARAGLHRLGVQPAHVHVLSYDLMLPAVGQGALAVEIREDDAEVAGFVCALDDPPTRRCVEAERSLLAALEGGCQVPIGAVAEPEAGNRIRLRAVICSLDGRDVVRGEIDADACAAVQMGGDLARRLRADGADKILAALRRDSVR